MKRYMPLLSKWIEYYGSLFQYLCPIIDKLCDDLGKPDSTKNPFNIDEIIYFLFGKNHY